MFGCPGVYHIDTSWQPTKPGNYSRHEPRCGKLDGDSVVEPDGSLRCMECLRWISANKGEAT